MRIALVTAAILLSAGAGAAQQSTSTAPSAPDIVVTGQRLIDTQRALERCIAAHCSPDQDIAATLAHAENQFVAGAYKDARDTLDRSLGRNKALGKQYPVPVASLWRAQSRISVHLGESDTYRISQIEALDVLKNGLGQNDPRTLAQRLEVADAFAHLGRIEGALPMYRDVAKRAHIIGNTAMEGQALFHIAMLNSVLAEVQPAIYRYEAKRSIAALADTTAPEMEPFRNAVKLLQARMAAKEGDTAAVDRMVADFRSSNTRNPTLIYAPPISNDSADRAYSDGSMTGKMAVNTYENQWVDISFWIAPNGMVTDAAILRASPTLQKQWVDPVLKSIGGRRYSPLALKSSDPGLLRVERYTMTAHWATGTGTHLRVREGIPRIEMLDLTADPGPTKATQAAPG
ncbi:hypothetical protein [uncultured Sphingomonas sp.]|uniref:hypothetical protein n=1 Tax=uncultured Sphingomonas sp. TaxID=158754 RepID=UPI0035CB7D73